ncbi:MAG: Crp/Fnr family transcriptional regulator [Clostridiales bacterium]|nr:Crp/Fnr family transcriptional regulator [Clostridiales bacterium]
MRKEEKEALIKKYPALEYWIKYMPDTYLTPCRLRLYKRGEVIFGSGETPKYVYIICDGIGMVSSSNNQGNEMQVVYVKEGTTLGEAILRLKSMKYSANAFTDCAVFEIPYVYFNEWIDNDFNVTKKLNKMFAEKVYQSSSTIEQYNYLKTETCLKMLFINNGAGTIKETREELAKACGVSVRTIYRIIRKLAKDNLVTMSHGKVKLSEQQIEQLQDCISEES